VNIGTGWGRRASLVKKVVGLPDLGDAGDRHPRSHLLAPMVHDESDGILHRLDHDGVSGLPGRAWAQCSSPWEWVRAGSGRAGSPPHPDHQGR
jgi:hypothetical protein